MLIDIIILVLRETLEAGALISVLLCVSGQRKIAKNWLWNGLLLGLVFAIIYAANFSQISEWFDYAGQEALNAAMLIGIYICLIVIALWLIFRVSGGERLLGIIMTLSVMLVITRELAEMVIFYTGFFQSDGALANALTSGFVGLMVGISFGVLCYISINSWRPSISRILQVSLLTLISAGMAVQATQLLMQIDWVASGKSTWDSNWLLSESSTLGQMTYAVFGYEATPTQPEVWLYLCTIVFMCLAVGWQQFRQNPHSPAT